MNVKDEISKKRFNMFVIKGEIHALAKSAMPEYDFFHEIGEWDCDKSPLGLCVYDKVNDPALDDCIFCHEPHERK